MGLQPVPVQRPGKSQAGPLAPEKECLMESGFPDPGQPTPPRGPGPTPEPVPLPEPGPPPVPEPTPDPAVPPPARPGGPGPGNPPST